MLNRITIAGQKVEVLSWKNGKPVVFSIEGKQSSLQKEIFEIAFPEVFPDIKEIIDAYIKNEYVDNFSLSALTEDKLNLSAVLKLNDGEILDTSNFWNMTRSIAKQLEKDLIDAGHKLILIELGTNIRYHAGLLYIDIKIS